jgi:hypothetical protein
LLPCPLKFALRKKLPRRGPAARDSLSITVADVEDAFNAKEIWPDVETKSWSASGHRRLPAAEIDMSDMLACLCGCGISARARVPDFHEIFAADDCRLSWYHGGGARFSCITTPRPRALWLGLIAAVLI